MAKRVYIEGLMDPENRVDGAETIQIDHPLEDPNFVRTPPRDRSEVIPWDETLAIEAIIMSLRSKRSIHSSRRRHYQLKQSHFEFWLQRHASRY